MKRAQVTSHRSVRRKKVVLTPKLLNIIVILGFLVLILTVVGVGYLGLTGMNALHNDLRSMAEQQWTDVQLATRALALSTRNTQLNTEIVTASQQTSTPALLAARERNSADIASILNRLQGRIGSQREQAELSAIRAGRDAYRESYLHVTDIVVNEHDFPKARRELVQVTFPLMLKYHAAWSDYIRFQSDEMNDYLSASGNRYMTAHKRTLALVGLFVLLAAGIATFVVRSIQMENARRMIAEKNLVKINETLEMTVAQRTAALIRANRDLVSEIKTRQMITQNLHSETTFLEALANSTLDGILVVDDTMRKRFQNNKFVEIFRMPPEVVADASDQNTLEYVLRQIEEPDQFVSKVSYLYAHPNQVSVDEIRLVDGRIMDRFSSPVIDKQGKCYGRIWVFRDATEQRRSAEVVRRLSLALEQSPVSVLMTDVNGAITYVNRKFVECTGYSYEEVIGKNPRILKSGKTSDEEYKQLWNTLKSGNEWRGDLCNKKKNGELFWEAAVLCPIKDEAGRITHFLAMKEDITERRFLEQQLRQAQKLEGIGQLAAGIAHEINTPTQFVSDNLTFLRDSWTAAFQLLEQYRQAVRSERASMSSILAELERAEAECDLDFIVTEVPRAIDQGLEGTRRVAKIVRAMKDFSHPDSAEKTATDLNKAIESTVTVARNEWKYVAELTTEFAPDLPPVVCYPGEVEQVILNLLVNSAHAVKEKVKDGKKGQITIKTRKCGEMAEITIADSGTGIPEAIRSKVFDPFFTTKDVGKGTGQGLALAYGVVVKKHGGKIWFESEEGKGTTFYIHLPIKMATAMAAART